MPKNKCYIERCLETGEVIVGDYRICKKHNDIFVNKHVMIYKEYKFIITDKNLADLDKIFYFVDLFAEKRLTQDLITYTNLFTFRYILRETILNIMKTKYNKDIFIYEDIYKLPYSDVHNIVSQAFEKRYKYSIWEWEMK